MNRQKIMKLSNQIAKKLVKDTDDYKLALSLGLKFTWKMAKQGVDCFKIADALLDIKGIKKYKPMVTFGIPNWVIKNPAIIEGAEKISLKKVTEKAKLFTIDYDDKFDGKRKADIWAPKKVLGGQAAAMTEITSDDILGIPEFELKKQFDYLETYKAYKVIIGAKSIKVLKETEDKKLIEINYINKYDGDTSVSFWFDKSKLSDEAAQLKFGETAAVK